MFSEVVVSMDMLSRVPTAYMYTKTWCRLYSIFPSNGCEMLTHSIFTSLITELSIFLRFIHDFSSVKWWSIFFNHFSIGCLLFLINKSSLHNLIPCWLNEYCRYFLSFHFVNGVLCWVLINILKFTNLILHIYQSIFR